MVFCEETIRCALCQVTWLWRLTSLQANQQTGTIAILKMKTLQLLLINVLILVLTLLSKGDDASEESESEEEVEEGGVIIRRKKHKKKG